MPNRSEESEESGNSQEHRLFVGARAALISGVVVGAVVLGSQLFIGLIYTGHSRRDLVAAMTSPASTLSTSVITGTATILALMLTMLSLSHSLNQQLGRPFYTRIGRISLLAIVDMIASIVVLLVLSSPIQTATQQSQQVGGPAVSATYYTLVGLTAIVAGVFVATIVMLYNAVTTVIEAVKPSALSKS